MFEASNVALQFVASLRPIVEIVAERDPNLADQLRRAATSAALNTAEAGRRSGRDQRNRARIAAGECPNPNPSPSPSPSPNPNPSPSPSPNPNRRTAVVACPR